jgi:AraC-like DNA-binding protein
MTRGARLVETRPSGHGRARGLVSSPASGRRIESRTYASPADLADVVATYWTGRWDLREQPAHTTLLISDPCVNLVCEQGGAHAGSRLVGVWTRLWSRTLEARGMVRGVKLRAGAMRAFVDRPAHAFANRIVALGSLFDDAPALTEQVLASDDEDGFAAWTQWLRAHRRPDDDGQISLAAAIVARIAAQPDITDVDRLAVVAGLGTRALQRLFREHVGASPKWVIRRKRLQEVALRIERGEAANFASLAAELGYTDQSHLARDFKTAVGMTPSAFAASIAAKA